MIKAVFMGTPQIAVNSLNKLLNFNDLQILAVVTQPDRPCGRGNKITPPPVKEAAIKNGLTVYQTPSIKKDIQLIETLKALEPDFFITFAFGQILTQEILDIPKIATINLHASLLPAYRGANPIQRAIYNGEKLTGITTMITVLELDAGDICLQEKISIAENMTDAELSKVISDKSPFLIYPTLKGLYNKTLTPTAQPDDGITIAKKFTKEDGLINWQKSAIEIHNQIRSMTVWPCAYTTYCGKIIKLIESECIDDDVNAPGEVLEITKTGIKVGTAKGTLLIKKLKPEGKPLLNAFAWTNGAKLKSGCVFV